MHWKGSLEREARRNARNCFATADAAYMAICFFGPVAHLAPVAYCGPDAVKALFSLRSNDLLDVENIGVNVSGSLGLLQVSGDPRTPLPAPGGKQIQ